MLCWGHAQSHLKFQSSNQFSVYLLWFEWCPFVFLCWELWTQCNGAGRWNLEEVVRMQEDLPFKDALEAEIERGAVEGLGCGGSGLWKGWEKGEREGEGGLRGVGYRE